MPRNSPRSFWMDAPPPVEPLRLRRLPMLLAAASFALGILFARQWHGTLLLLTATLLLCCFSRFFALHRFPRARRRNDRLPGLGTLDRRRLLVRHPAASDPTTKPAPQLSPTA